MNLNKWQRQQMEIDNLTESQASKLGKLTKMQERQILYMKKLEDKLMVMCMRNSNLSGSIDISCTNNTTGKGVELHCPSGVISWIRRFAEHYTWIDVMGNIR